MRLFAFLEVLCKNQQSLGIVQAGAAVKLLMRRTFFKLGTKPLAKVQRRGRGSKRGGPCKYCGELLCREVQKQ